MTTWRETFLCAAPNVLTYVSIIQTIVWELVPTSGAGMSKSGPMLLPSAWVNRRVMRSSSVWLYFVGSIWMPPLPPPKGRPAREHFQVIQAASAFTSSWLTWGW